MTRTHIAMLAMLTVPAVAAGGEPTWYVTTTAAQSAVMLSAERRTFDVGSGWSCAVSPSSTFGARTTTCRKGSEAFEFSVQCSGARDADHVQIRFLGSTGAPSFIEVGCRISAP
jgi:hypothetical protein